MPLSAKNKYLVIKRRGNEREFFTFHHCRNMGILALLHFVLNDHEVLCSHAEASGPRKSYRINLNIITDYNK